jgi:hypothetical protein
MGLVFMLRSLSYPHISLFFTLACFTKEIRIEALMIVVGRCVWAFPP